MKGQRYELVEAIEKAVTTELNSIETDAFQKAFSDLYIRAHHCIELRGDIMKA